MALNMLKNWKQVYFTADLVELAKYHLDFLRLFNLQPNLDNIAKAAYRYEKHWLPIYSSLNKAGENLKDFYPPTDVAWIWTCHLLSPTNYINDCSERFGDVLPHFLSNPTEMAKKQKGTKELWERYLNASFDYESENSIRDKHDFKNFRSQFSYNLIEASNRQKGFYYQVSLPHYRDDAFLKLCLERYKKFLYLKSINKNEYIVPCYGIDLIWHTHQLSPIEYANDTIRILGYIFPHDDTTNDRSPGSKLVVSDRNTRNLWEKAYGEKFHFSGGMYRGEGPDKENFSKNSGLDTYFHRKKLIDFRYDKSPFIIVQMNDILHEYKAFDLKNNQFNDKNGMAFRAQYSISAKDNNRESRNIYQVDILINRSLDWASVKVMRENKLLATSHLVDSSQLPSKFQVNAGKFSYLTFDPKTERAMIVRNINGDYALVKAQWVGFRKSVFRKKTLLSHLKVTKYSFDSGLVQTINVNNRFTLHTSGRFERSLDFNESEITIDLKNSYESLEVESDLAIGFSINVLKYLLKPISKNNDSSVAGDSTGSNVFFIFTNHEENINAGKDNASGESGESGEGGSCGGGSCGGCGGCGG